MIITNSTSLRHRPGLQVEPDGLCGHLCVFAGQIDLGFRLDWLEWEQGSTNWLPFQLILSVPSPVGIPLALQPGGSPSPTPKQDPSTALSISILGRSLCSVPSSGTVPCIDLGMKAPFIFLP